MNSNPVLLIAQRLQAISQIGLTYATSPYDIERYEEIRRLSVSLLQEVSEEPYEKIVRLFASETGYQTPKVDIRAVLFRGLNEVLLVQERIDNGKWALPGGWADVGYTPGDVAAKEVLEETGLLVEPNRLLAVLDMRKHPHPPRPWYVYKIFLQCEIRGGELKQETSETFGARWVHRNEVPAIELSTERVTASQLEALFRLAGDPGLPALFD